MKVTYHTFPLTSKMLDYAVNVYQNDTFVKCIRFEGYSGTAVEEEVRWLKKDYPASQGYQLKW